MANEVQISRGVLAVLIGALIVSLLGIAFLLGRQSAPPPVAQAEATPELTPSSPPLAAVQAPEEQNLTERLDKIEKRVNNVRERETLRVGAAPNDVGHSAPSDPVRPPQETSRAAPGVSSTEVEERVAYFRQVDSILQSTPAIEDPNRLATKFLEQAMSGDTSEFESLLATTRRTSAALQAITPPPACREHHSLLLRQVTQGAELLTEIQQALSTNDTSRLNAVAARGQQMQADTARLRQLERELRGGKV